MDKENRFIYKDLPSAEHDLSLFSTMNIHENKILAIVCCPGGMFITSHLESVNPELIDCMAFNGRIFTGK